MGDLLKIEGLPGGASSLHRLHGRQKGGARWQQRLYPYLSDIAGITFVLVSALAYLSPALKDGLSFGPAELGRQLSIFTIPNHPLPQIHDVINGDIVTQGVAWNTLNWLLVHHGQLPLWNDQSGNGLPQFLNFESAPLALPSLIGYLVPLRDSYLVTVLIKLLIAGTGAYAIVRLLGGRALPSALAGTSAMLAGPFAGWLGWSISGPLAWTGWIVAGSLLLYRAPPGRRGWRYVLLALSTAFCIFGGFPEDYVLMGGALLLLFAVGGVAYAVAHHSVDWRGLGRLMTSFGAGLAISAPLWLPGIAILRNSVRDTEPASTGLPLHALTLLVAQGYDGLPLGTSQFPHGTYFGPLDYFETAAYIGVVALVLAGTCVVLAWQRPAVMGLVACAIGSGLVTYNLGSHAPIQHLIADVGLGTIALQRVLTELCFALAVLAGLGLEFLLQHWREPRTQRVFLVIVATLALVIGILWLRSSLPSVSLNGLGTLTSAQATSVRRRSLYWPTFEIIVLALVGVLVPLFARQPRRLHLHYNHRVRTLLGGLVGLQAVFLVIAGVGISSYADATYPQTTALTELQHVVGKQLFGIDGPTVTCDSQTSSLCGLRTWDGVGIYPEMNLGYGLTEFATHDPTTPREYFGDFPVPRTDRNGGGLNLFAPIVNTVSLARLYGIQYVLVLAPLPIPTGMKLVRTISAGGATVDVAQVPGSHRFSFNNTTHHEGMASATGAGHDSVIASIHPDNTQYIVKVRTPRAGRLIIRITNEPGWHATAGGHSLTLHRGAGDLMQTLVPRGTKAIILTYRPTLFVVGETVALLSLGVLLFYWLFERGRYLPMRRRPT